MCKTNDHVLFGEELQEVPKDKNKLKLMLNSWRTRLTKYTYEIPDISLPEGEIIPDAKESDVVVKITEKSKKTKNTLF